MRPALNRNDEALSQLSFGTKKCIWPKGGLRNTFYLFILCYAGEYSYYLTNGSGIEDCQITVLCQQNFDLRVPPRCDFERYSTIALFVFFCV